MLGLIIGLAIAALFAIVALGLYLGQNRRSARGDKTRVVREVTSTSDSEHERQIS